MAAKIQPSFSPRRRWLIGLDVVVRTALVLAVVVMLNYLGAQFFHRFYLSSQTNVGLSSRTLAVLNSLTNKLTVTLYYDTQDQDNFYPTLLALANEYHAANKNISIRTVDYKLEPGEAEKVKEQFNLPGAPTSPNAPPNKDLIIFACGDRHDVVPGEAIVRYKLEQTAPDRSEAEGIAVPQKAHRVQRRNHVHFQAPRARPRAAVQGVFFAARRRTVAH